MATSRQEQIYNEIVEYYNFADKLIDLIENSKDETDPEQLEITEKIVENLEKCADQLTTSFIDFVKEGNSEQNRKKIRDTLNDTIFQIEKYKGQIYALYNK
ncbi:MAG: hypothetical protein O3B09_00295 [Proteobacteria bacterium]|nr:hypothetical protein [Pseudomonadota bacterium]